MSAISSASSGSQVSLLQQLQQSNTAGRFNRADFQKQRQADFASALQAAGVDSSKISDIQSQIDAAVQGARQNGTSGTNTRDAVKTAVDNVLQKNGVDLTKFQQALKAAHQGHAHHARPKGGDGDGDADDGGSAPSVNESSESSQSGQSGNVVQTKLADLLKALASGTTQPSDVAAGTLLDVAA